MYEFTLIYSKPAKGLVHKTCTYYEHVLVVSVLFCDSSHYLWTKKSSDATWYAL